MLRTATSLDAGTDPGQSKTNPLCKFSTELRSKCGRTQNEEIPTDRYAVNVCDERSWPRQGFHRCEGSRRYSVAARCRWLDPALCDQIRVASNLPAGRS